MVPGFNGCSVFQEEAAWFIKVVMFFGSISGVIISIPCGVFLTMYWDPWTRDVGDGLLQLEMVLREAIRQIEQSL